LQCSSLESLDRISYRPIVKEVDGHTGRLEDVERIRANIAGHYRLRASLDDKLGSLDAGSTGGGYRRVLDGLKLQGLCLYDDDHGTTPKDGACRRVEGCAVRRESDLHLHSST
jgi:hypothetical protein